MFRSIADEVAWVTGAGSGIGQAGAVALAKAGAKLVLTGRRIEPLEETAAMVREAGGAALVAPADVSDAGEVQAVAKRIVEEHGRCDILVNSAGHTRPVAAADLDGLTDALIDELMRANFRGVFATIRAFAPLLKAGGDGLVVNISSIAGFTGVGSNLAYVAAKAGLDVVGDALAKALAPAVRVVSVAPGAVESSFVPGRGEDFKARMATTTPLGRIGKPDDVAATVEALATTLRFVTGTRIVVDGGRHL
jgi:3-oxoacyl-[acyl-carrier protein] reductase